MRRIFTQQIQNLQKNLLRALWRSPGLQEPGACSPGFVTMGDFHADDVFIAGFPKSGNTWMQVLVASLMYGLDPELAPDTLIQELVPDVHYKKVFKRFQTPTFFKTHLLPQPEYRRVINIVRDGRDIIASSRYFISVLGGNVAEGDTIDLPTQLGFGAWHDHIEAWHANPFGAVMLVVRYEDLIDDCVGQLERMADFVGVAPSRQRLAAIASATTAERMKARERRVQWDNSSWPKDRPFIRQGRKGGFREELTPDQIRRFTARAGRALALCGYVDTTSQRAAA